MDPTVAGVYVPVNGVLTDVQGAGGVSPVDAPRSVRARDPADFFGPFYGQ